MPVLHPDGKTPVTIALDFDGVLHVHDGKMTPDPSGLPVPGAVEAVRALHAQGYRVVVHSCRSAEGHAHWVGVLEWMRRHGFPPVAVSGVKPEASLYVDDRGFRFEGPGSWTTLFELLRTNPIPGRWGKPKQSPGSEVPASLPESVR